MVLGALSSWPVRADVLPPPHHLECNLGEDIETDHGGQRCVARRCTSAVVCPAGWACTPREERSCDPRGAPCKTYTVSRCHKADLPRPRCPQTALEDDKRTAEVVTLLRKHQRGQDIFKRIARPLVVCYGDVREGVVQEDDVLVLQRDRPVTAQAARLAHLLAHLVWWPPFLKDQVRASQEPCTAVAARAVEIEQPAGNLESELRKSFGLPPLPEEDLRKSYEQRCREVRRK